MADHALVFMFRPYRSSWVQPFSVFSSKSAAPAADLYRLLMKALILLEARGARVLSVVCDGASPNQTLWCIWKRFSQSEKIQQNGTPYDTT